ncbi:Putative pre-16S rRNA nuclease [Buchnera aphidicola (Eriosoma lanigerum)]|uniref:Holliday junction resolvase RuvX n=1 Tax=Buchnera aphidicola TaxID=9 RepID=UPI00346435C2
MYIIGFDFGTKNIGVAIGQTLTFTAQPLQSIQSKHSIPNWNIITNILFEWKPKIIVVGLPLNMDGTKQNITYQAETFANQIETKFYLQVKLHDERLSTIEAKSILFQKHGFKSLDKTKIDSISAMIILESWFQKNI